MTSFRFETYENIITKHHLKRVEWSTAAKWAFCNELGKDDVTVASVRMLDEDTVEIIKRRDQNKGLFYRIGWS